MHILHVIPGLSNASGPTHVVVNLCERMADHGHSVSIYYLENWQSDTILPVHPNLSVEAFPFGPIRKWGFSSALRNTLKQRMAEFDIVHIHALWLYPQVVAARTAWEKGVPYLVRPIGSLEPWALSSQGRLRKKLYMSLIERRHLDKAAAIHATSQQEAANISKLGIRTKIVMVPNGINFDEYHNLPSCEVFRNRFNISSDEKIILYIGRLHPIKGIDILIDAFSQVHNHMSDVVLAIVGPFETGYKTTITNQILHRGISKSVVFTGELQGRDKLSAYAAADVFVLPSHSENFGIVVAEAMAAGLPVVVSRNAPWADIETCDAGFWVNLDADEIADAILTVLGDPNLASKMGQNGRTLIKEKYTWDEIAKRMLRVYENIVVGVDPGTNLQDFESSQKNVSRVT